MNTETLQAIRNLLVRVAAVSFLLSLFMALATFGMWDTWIHWTSTLFHVPKEGLGQTMVDFFALVKFYVIFLLLAPAIALHWTISKRKS